MARRQGLSTEAQGQDVRKSIDDRCPYHLFETCNPLMADRCETDGRREESRPAAICREFLTALWHRSDQASNGAIELPSGRRERPWMGPRITEGRAIGRQHCRNGICSPGGPRNNQRIHEVPSNMDMMCRHSTK